MPSTVDFVHLHVHSHYSLLDGANRIEDLVAAAQKDGHKAIALTDHGNLFGAVEHYSKAKKAGVKPIIGCESYIARKSRLEKVDKATNPYDHLTLLCADRDGYQNLVKLASVAFLEGYHTRPRIDMEMLSRHRKGLVALSGCLSSQMSRLCRTGDEDCAVKLAGQMSDLFGKGNFYLELMRNGMELQARVTESLVRIGKRTGLPLVATNDIHYLRHEDCKAQDVLLCINTGATVKEEKRFKMDTDTLYFRTKEEMGIAFADLPDSLRSTVEIAEKCNLELELGKYRLPKFHTGTEESPEQLFDRLCEEGFERRYPAESTAPEKRASARQRLLAEMNVIRSMGFVAYFLIVWDLIRYARESGIPVGPGRGSAAGSIVAFVLWITDVDPLRYDLLFERFLNPERISMPDIDIDFCMENRGRMIEYAKRKYGADCVSQIVSFSAMKAKAALRDVGRAMDIPLPEVDRIARKVPDGPNVVLEKCISEDSDLQSFEEDPRYSDLFQVARTVEGLNRHATVHAAGVVISDVPLDTVVPLYKAGDDVMTQFDMESLEKVGLLKMDFLGLRTLTILEKARELVRKRTGTAPDLEHLAFDDPKAYELLTAGRTLGVFQLESEGMRRLLAKIKPNRFEDIIAVLALYRPGPLGMGMHDIYAERKNGIQPIEYPEARTEPILNETYGVIVYQEQVMRIANHLAGFSLAQADTLRKAMGKKNPELMAKFEQTFVDGCGKNGVAKDRAQTIWQLIVKFAEYGFNKSHTAAYAVLTYRTAWLKANHPVEFFAANMTCEANDTDKVKEFVDDARKSGVKVLGPDLTRSVREFDTEAQADGSYAIRYGLAAIKGLGTRAADALVDARRRQGKFKSFSHVAESVEGGQLNRAAMEALIAAGAFDWTQIERGRLSQQLDAVLAEAAAAQADRRAGQKSLFGAADDEGSAAATAPKGPRPLGPLPGNPVWTVQERLAREKTALGFYLSGHPMERLDSLLRGMGVKPLGSLSELAPDSPVLVAGTVSALKEARVKQGQMAGQKMARFHLEDLSGSVAVVVFPRTYAEVGELLATDGAVVSIRGKVDRRTEEPAIVAEKVEHAEKALAAFDGAVAIRLHAIEMGRLPDLLRMAREIPGPTLVLLDVEEEDGYVTRMRLSESFRVAPGESLARMVAAILGPGRLNLVRF
ncbi:MAG: DNA polymerase III subunit alpha [Planctomycetes bacterium]|nr:DNA polymerase III subunit alpha [Planctomycetota bacterium]